MAAFSNDQSTLTREEVGHSSFETSSERSSAKISTTSFYKSEYGSFLSPAKNLPREHNDSQQKSQPSNSDQTQQSTSQEIKARDQSVHPSYPDEENKTEQSSNTEVKLKKVLGLWHGIGMNVGTMIGAGIFVSPYTVVRYTGSVGMALVVWTVTGLMSMMGALSYAELGTMIPRSGSKYAYILEAFGPCPAFLAVWSSSIISEPSSIALVAITFANYLLLPLFPTCMEPPYIAIRLIAAAVISGIAYIHCSGVQLGARVQTLLALCKVLALTVIIVAGVNHLAWGNTEQFLDPMRGTIWEVSSIITAFYSTIFSYSGWDSLNYVTEELADSNKDLPRAIIFSLMLVTIVYTLTNVAYYAVLTPAEIVSSNAVAVTFGSRVLGSLVWIIAAFVSCTTCGNINGNIFTHSRLVYAGARDRHLPHLLAYIQLDRCTPITAIIFVAVISLMILTVEDVGGLLTFASFTSVLVNLTAIASLIWLRYKQPDRPRPFKVWLGFPIMYLALSIVVAVMPVVKQPLEMAVSVGLILTGLLIYYISSHMKTIPHFKDAMDKVNYMCQNLLRCAPEKAD
ncbi:Y+L amino acid transporter 2 [Cherax quadricarinatus]|uniref:Y+L amino acid transporter 2 n=1 Tax=Cherax quadricarinatus TaxID=27406 RepID=UPI0023789194|nr:Y+L amino acid transporter 2-like [Cherax quadricarinatus]